MIQKIEITRVSTHALANSLMNTSEFEMKLVKLDGKLLAVLHDEDLAKWFGEEVKYQLNKCAIQNGDQADVEDVPDREEVQEKQSPWQEAELDGKEEI